MNSKPFPRRAPGVRVSSCSLPEVCSSAPGVAPAAAPPARRALRAHRHRSTRLRRRHVQCAARHRD